MTSQGPHTLPEDSQEEDGKGPLSRASGKKKLLVAVPSALICGSLAATGTGGSVVKILAVIFSAYAIAGAIQIVGGELVLTMARNWDAQPAWKKFLISVLVIGAALVVFFTIAILIAE